MTPRLKLDGITKRFSRVVANDDVSFEVAPGSIHGLIGENGAGKSTLVKIVYGLQKADSGSIALDGSVVAIPSPRAARRLGIGMVFQHFSLFEAMTVLENVALGMDDPPPRRALEAKVREVLKTYGLALDPHRMVHTLSVGERQRIEIVRALIQSPQLLIMDEPTSVLTPQEVDQLFAVLRRLASEGCSVLYISHKLGEIKALCSAATVIRAGRVVANLDPRETTTGAMAELMIGGDLKALQPKHVRLDEAPVRLKVANVSAPGEPPFGTRLENVSFDVRGGEILGIAGVAGNGQNELVSVLSGERTEGVSGSFLLDGEELAGRSIGERRKAGLVVLPEERNGHAAVPAMTLTENVVLSARQRGKLAAGGFLKLRAARAYAASILKTFSVRAAGPAVAAASLSGGNLQKFVVGREILSDPSVFVVSQPTWGVDAGAAAFIRQAMIDLATRGAAIIVLSQDLDELLELSDRIAVINEGRLSEPVGSSGVSIERIGLLMGGIHGSGEDAEMADQVAA